MDSFDELAQALANGVSRRQAIRRFAGGLTAAFVASVIPWGAPATTYARSVYGSVLLASGLVQPDSATASGVPGSSESSGSPWLMLGANGPDVEAVQYLLRNQGADIEVDGDFGGQTDGMVRAFQTWNGLEVDGIVGPQTWEALIVWIQIGDQGDAVSAAQTLLSWHGADIAVDGDFGEQTDGAVRDFQTSHGLEVDGAVGPRTWGALIIHP